MIQTLKNAWKVPELKNKILFTIFALLVFRLGSVVPAPFVNTAAGGRVSGPPGGPPSPTYPKPMRGQFPP